jgi:hypothetical protein
MHIALSRSPAWGPGWLGQMLRWGALLGGLVATGAALAQTAAVVDVPTRPGVTQRFLHLAPSQPARASVVLMAGGQGGLRIFDNGSLGWGENNFLVRSRQRFVDAGFAVAVVDAPSDRQYPPYLQDFRQTASHVQDVQAVIGWMRRQHGMPVWLVGTSRGTQSAAFVGTELPLAQGGPDGIVLSSSITQDRAARAVPDMPLDRIGVPVLVMHHEQDACRVCPFSRVPDIMEKLKARGPAVRSDLIAFRGGQSTGPACEAWAHHGFNGLEDEVVAKMAAWIAPR